MGRPASGRRRAGSGRLTSDILADQPAAADLLAELYDLEHDEIDDDLAFYREMARRHPGAVADLGCGSGRLFASFLGGGASAISGVDGSPALLARARERIDADAGLRAARDAGRITLEVGDVRHVRRPEQYALVVLAGVLSHLDGPQDALEALVAARRLLEPDGTVVVDSLGPGGLPPHDLPLSVDWDRAIGGRRVVRRSQLERRQTPEGLRVAYATLTDLVEADGTMARLPASFRLWYPSATALQALVVEAGLKVVATYGSHDLDPLDGDSQRCIVVARPATADSGTG
jgi:SAM-dependent methyltransferase